MNNSKLTKEIIGYLLTANFKWLYETRDYNEVKNDTFKYTSQTVDSEPQLHHKRYLDFWEYNKLPIKWRKSSIQKVTYSCNRPSFISIGNNSRYSKTFSIEDIGIKIKPIVYESEDRFGLINAGIAVDAKTVNK